MKRATEITTDPKNYYNANDQIYSPANNAFDPFLTKDQERK
jgi:hypothetical protein